MSKKLVILETLVKVIDPDDNPYGAKTIEDVVDGYYEDMIRVEPEEISGRAFFTMELEEGKELSEEHPLSKIYKIMEENNEEPVDW